MNCIILAGGLGKRMNSDIPKVLHFVKNKPMIVHIIETINKINNVHKIIIVVGKYHLQIKITINSFIQNTSNIEYAYQPEPLGTGHALKCALNLVDSPTLILNGDTPLITSETLRKVIEFSKDKNLVVVSIRLNQPFGNGRILIENGKFIGIVEEKDCTPEEKEIQLVNCGIYFIQTEILNELIPRIENNNSSSEYYLTDIVKLYQKEKNIFVLEENQWREISNINTQQQLQEINNEFRD